MSPIISVIIPIYNAQEFLYTTLNSVLSQHFTNWEMILINDGSSDDSERICLEFVRKDKRISFINQINRGANAARGLGLKYSKGQYIYFLDADDSMDNNELFTLYNEIGDADILMGGCSDELCLNRYEFLSTFLNHQLPFGLCGNLYKRSILKEEYFQTPRELRMGEDMLSNVMISKNILLFKSIKKSNHIINTSNRDSISRSFVRDLEYERKFDSYLELILAKLMPGKKLGRYLAVQRFYAFSFLILEDRNLNIHDKFISNLLNASKLMPKGYFPFERFLLKYIPTKISVKIIRYIILLKRKIG